MKEAGEALVATAPGGPEKGCKDMADFPWSQGNRLQCRRGGRSGGRKSAEGAQKGEGEQDEGDVTIPGREAAHLGTVQAKVFGGFKILLDVPASAAGFNHGGKRGAGRSEDQEKPEQRRIIATAADEEPVLAIVAALMEQGEACPVVQARAFAALAHREGLPEEGGPQQCWHGTRFQTATGAIGQREDDGFLAGNGQDVGEMATLETGSQVGIAPVDAIGDDPGDGYGWAGLQQAGEHEGGELGFGQEATSLRDAGLLAARAIGDPVGGEVEFAINEGMACGGDKAEKDADLAVFDLPGAAAPLGFDASGMSALFGKAGLIEGQDADLGAQMLDGIGPQVIAEQIGVPDRVGEQVLHAIGGGFASVFGELPTAFALHRAQQSFQIRQSALARLGAGETGSDALMQLHELLGPIDDLSKSRRHRKGCVMLRGLHAFLLGLILLRDINLNMSHQPERRMKLVFLGENRAFVEVFKCYCSASQAWIPMPTSVATRRPSAIRRDSAMPRHLAGGVVEEIVRTPLLATRV